MCPVCGYNMQDPPRDYNICPSCGTEFGVSDVDASVQELRAAWLKTGARWWSDTECVPEGWNPASQLAEALLNESVVQRRTFQGVVHITSVVSYSSNLAPAGRAA